MKTGGFHSYQNGVKQTPVRKKSSDRQHCVQGQNNYHGARGFTLLVHSLLVMANHIRVFVEGYGNSFDN